MSQCDERWPVSGEQTSMELSALISHLIIAR